MSDDLVTIATFLNIGEAKLAQGKLSSAGIDASVRDENAMNLHIGMAMWGIKLQVPDHQMVRALEILDDFRPGPGGEETESDSDVVQCCPECESLEIRRIAQSNPRQITLWSAAIPFPEASATQGQRWRCLACGHQWEETED
jgi:Putative prokaryotic signal transducing protein